MLGDTDQILGSVPQNAQVINQEQERKDNLGTGRAEEAMAPANAAGKEGAVQTAVRQANQVAISPQMAKGLEKMTGQSWDQSVGTKWDPHVFTAIVSGMSQAKYHQDLLNDKDRLESMREKARLDQIDFKGQVDEDMKKHLTEYREQEDERFVKFLNDHGYTKSGATPASKKPTKPKDTDPQSLGKELLEEINKGTKSGDSVVKQAAIDNYNSYAKKYSLATYTPEPEFLDKAMSAIKSLGGGGGGKGDKVGATQQYKSPQEVGEALKSGKIKRDEAEKILKDQFNMQ